MKNLQEIIAEVNRYNGTDDRVICTWFRWGEIKLLVDLLRSNSSLDNELDETLPNEIEMLNDTVSDLNEDLSAEQRGWTEATWAQKKYIKLLEQIVRNTKS